MKLAYHNAKQTKETYRIMSLLSIGFKILKALANFIQHIKNIMHHN